MQRIQRQRRKDWRMPPNAKYIGRPTKWGNPYTMKPVGAEWEIYEWDESLEIKLPSQEAALAQCLKFYRLWAELQIDFEPKWLEPLRDYDLACWCPLDQACHADILLELLQE